MNLKLLLSSAIIMLTIDSFYLYNIRNLFQKQISNIQKSALRLEYLSAGLCYLVLIFGINYFILYERKSVFDAMLLGWVIYFVYELTNKAIFKNWNWKTVAVDGIWGGILFGITTLLTYKLNGIK